VAGIDWAALERVATLAVVLPVPEWALMRYVADAKLSPDMARRLYCDPSGALFAAAGCNLRFDSRSKFTSPHAKTSVLAATWKGFALGVTTGMQGDPRQQGGCFILARRESASAGGETVVVGSGAEAVAAGAGTAAVMPRTVWAHLDRHNADQVPIPVIMNAAGLPPSLYTQPAHA